MDFLPWILRLSIAPIFLRKHTSSFLHSSPNTTHTPINHNSSIFHASSSFKFLMIPQQKSQLANASDHFHLYKIPYTPAEKNSSPLKNDAWNTSLLFGARPFFRGRTVKLQEGQITSFFGFGSPLEIQHR